MIKVGEIEPYTTNAKKHTKSQIAKVKESIKRFGIRQPLVVDKEMNLVVGHARLEACKRLKLKQVPCVVADDLSDGEIIAYRLADNKLNESEWDMDLVHDELSGLDDDLIDLTGFTLEKLLEEPDPLSEEEDAEPQKGECPNCSVELYILKSGELRAIED